MLIKEKMDFSYNAIEIGQNKFNDQTKVLKLLIISFKGKKAMVTILKTNPDTNAGSNKRYSSRYFISLQDIFYQVSLICIFKNPKTI